MVVWVSEAAVIVLIIYQPLELDIVSNGSAYFRDVFVSQRLLNIITSHLQVLEIVELIACTI